jgi:flagellar hook-basal body complex protein FliE
MQQERTQADGRPTWVRHPQNRTPAQAKGNLMSNYDNVVDLQKKRVEKAEPFDLKPIDILKQAIEAIEKGEANPKMLYIAGYTEAGDNEILYDWWYAGGNKVELLGMLSRHLHLQNDRNV